MAIYPYRCRDCGHIIELDEGDVVKNGSFECEECGAEYIITRVEPFRAEPME